ncbi:MAG TPA: hypothetical protein GX506_10675 [Firmicutes bacterium]|nr:hypothetical protein [Bacillota bacterium]
MQGRLGETTPLSLRPGRSLVSRLAHNPGPERRLRPGHNSGRGCLAEGPRPPRASRAGILLMAMVTMMIAAASITLIAGYSSREATENGTTAWRLPMGTMICGVEFGGLTREEAISRLRGIATILETRPVALSHEDQVWIFDPRAVEMRVLVEATIERAFAELERGFRGIPGPGNGQPGIGRGANRSGSHSGVAEISPVITGDTGALRQYLSALAVEINHQPRNAYIFIDQKDQVHLVRSAPGHSLDWRATWTRLFEALQSPVGREIQLSVTEVDPLVTTEDVQAMGIRELVSSFSTQLGSLAEDRVHNIELAIEAIDGCTIAPGEEFSFNAIVGPRSREAGYKEAPVVLNSELVPGIGGGICQVSSTLYNAALLANLDITARTPHSIAPAYVPPGRDATVAYNYLDLRFKNSLPSHIMVVARLEGRSVVVKLFGTKPRDQEISIDVRIEEKLHPRIIEKRDPTLAPGERKMEDNGSPGYVVSVWRLVKKGGSIYRELISRDRYDPRPALVRVNYEPGGDMGPVSGAARDGDRPAAAW